MSHVLTEKIFIMEDLLRVTAMVTPFQRRSAWKKDTLKAYLVDDFLAGNYIPPIVLSKINDNSYKVLDGLQRISTYRAYVEGRVTEDKNGKVTNEKIEKLKASTIKIHVISDLSEQEELDLFLRLNQNKVMLISPELRRAQFFQNPVMQVFNKDLLSYGSVTNWARIFYNVLLGDKPKDIEVHKLHDRCKDEEYALMMLVFSNYKGEELTKNKNSFLDEFLIKEEKKNKTQLDVRKELELLMSKTLTMSNIIQDNNINFELRLRATSIAAGMFDEKTLNNMNREIHNVIISVSNKGDYNSDDHRNITYWNLALQDCFKLLSELKISSRNFKEQDIRKK